MGSYILSFIKMNPQNWVEKLSSAPYSLKMNRVGDLVKFNYRTFESEVNPITNEARGIIIDTKEMKVVAYSFPRFFNYNDENAAVLYKDVSTWSITEKVDGSLIQIYLYNGQIMISTRGMINADAAKVMDGEVSFGDLVRQALHGQSLHLFPNRTYLFELTAPQNRVVIDYGAVPQLHYLTTYDNITLDEIDTYSYWETLGVSRPQTYYFSSLTDVQDYFNGLDELHEGVVIRDIFGSRVKVKTNAYFEAHRLANNGQLLPIKKLDEVVANNEADDFLSAQKGGSLYDTYVDLINFILYNERVAYTYLENIYAHDFADWSSLSRRDFADKVKTYNGIIRTYLFSFYDRGWEQTLERMPIIKNYHKILEAI